MRNRILVPVVFALAIVAGAAAVVLPSGQQAKAKSCPPGIEKVINIYAYRARVACGLEEAPVVSSAGTSQPGPLIIGTDKNIILPDGNWPYVTQTEAQVATNTSGTVVVAAYNDSRGDNNNPLCGGNVSYSTNSGSSWTVVATNPATSPFCQTVPNGGHGENDGDPVMVWNKKFSKFIVIFMNKGCGGAGLGTWTSTDGISWPTGACAHNGTADDRPSGWVDNTPTSPHYGRVYVTYNDGNALKTVFMDENTQNWSATPVTIATDISGRVARNMQVTVGLDGTIFEASMDENLGGLNARWNYLFKSTDGAATWSAPILMAPVGTPAFAAPGVAACGSGTPAQYACMFKVNTQKRWRYMGWGEIGASANGTVHYIYTQHGTGTDPGDIFYTRSTDNGATWSAPSKLNTDGGTFAQWMPSLAVDANGDVVVNWYDAVDSSNHYEVHARTSTDNGINWTPEQTISDSASPLPESGDLPGYFAGDYDRSYAGPGSIYHFVWTDGHVQKQDSMQVWHYQQDINYDNLCVPPAGGVCIQ